MLISTGETMESNVRDSGIEMVGHIPWGTHFCLFYETYEDLLDILIPYFLAGLRNNELCVCITSEPIDLDSFATKMAGSIPGFSEYVEKGQIEVIPYSEWYLLNGTFDSKAVLNAWVDKLNKALARGFSGLRLAANKFWLESHAWKDFMDYERAADGFIEKHRMVAMCLYPVEKCRAGEILDVAGTHEFAMARSDGNWKIIENHENWETKAALRESEERLRLLVDNLPGLNVYQITRATDGQFYYNYVSQGNNSVLGRVSDTAHREYKAFLDSIHPDDLGPVIKATEESYDYLTKFDMIYRRRDGNGVYRWFHSCSVPHRLEDGSTVWAGFSEDITERKRLEDALRDSEKQLKSRLDAILSPDSDFGEEFADIVDMPALREIADSFYELTGVVLAILDLKGNILIANGWQDICTKFHRCHPVTAKNCLESDLHLSGLVAEGEYVQYKCMNGLWDTVTPIVINGKHMANLFSGQFFLEDDVIDYDHFRRQAEKYGFNKEEYMAALDRIPRLSREKIRSAMEFYTKFASMISRLSLSNVQLARSLAEQKRAREKLRESEERLRLAQDSANIGVWDWNIRTDELSFTPELNRLYGISSPGIIKTLQEWRRWAHPDDLESTDAGLDKAIAQHEQFDLEFRIFHSSGEIRWITAKGSAIYNDAGEAVRVLGVNIDITERKRSEKVREELLEKIAQSNKELAAVTEIVSGAFASLDMDEVIKNILGRSRDTLNSDTAVFLERDDNLLKVRSSIGIEDEVRGQLSLPIGRGFAGIIAATKKPLYVEDAQKSDLVVSPVIKAKNIHSMLGVPVIADDNVIGVMHVGWLDKHPFSEEEQRILQVSANRCASAIINARLYGKTRALKQQSDLYVDLMGHDISNINQIAMGYLELANDMLELDEANKELISKPMEALKSSARLIENVRKLQRLNEGGQKMDVIDLNDVLSGLRERYLAASDKKLTINYEQKAGCMVMADSLINDVFSNLIENAIKHSGGRKAVEINIEVSRAAIDGRDHHKVTIEDNGPGISDEMKSKIFIRFQKGNTKAEGKGLGLYLVMALVEVYHGKVWVEDRVPGDYTKGSRFVVMLPAIQ